MNNSRKGSKYIFLAIAKSTVHGRFPLVGVGDSVVVVNKFHPTGNISHVFTGGGVSLSIRREKCCRGVKSILED
jgi:3-phosphoglycerate kinase